MMPTDAITKEALTQYGLAGFVVVVCLLSLVFVLKDLLKKSDKKDAQILEMGNKFASSLDANTNALMKMNETEIRLAAAADKFQTWLSDAIKAGEKEHAEILTFVRRQART